MSERFENLVTALLTDNRMSSEIRKTVEALSQEAFIGPQLAGLLEPNSIPVRAVKTPIVTSLPQGAQEGDQILFVPPSSGVVWQFVYLPRQSKPYPWYFIGGAPLHDIVQASEAGSINAWVDTATVGPTVTVPLSGDYDVCGRALAASNSGAVRVHLAVAVNGTVGQLDSAADLAATGHYQALELRRRMTGLSSSDALKLMYYFINAGTVEGRNIVATPIRVGR